MLVDALTVRRLECPFHRTITLKIEFKSDANIAISCGRRNRRWATSLLCAMIGGARLFAGVGAASALPNRRPLNLAPVPPAPLAVRHADEQDVAAVLLQGRGVAAGAYLVQGRVGAAVHLELDDRRGPGWPPGGGGWRRPRRPGRGSRPGGAGRSPTRRVSPRWGCGTRPTRGRRPGSPGGRGRSARRRGSRWSPAS